ncbi:MFS transporter [Actinoplanes sp. L3-i22]|uniref:MFS transporter n=1 Tax=Actinoplanes sp. L3-i22 TaxID=2836373 RepID=UPI001C77DB3C|nr:MFS transporter [Actinoplanes sp. L3-i22]BCY10847.1 hypothetical protein L3i22_059350 [Actinoplanes sp. L3-i22]
MVALALLVVSVPPLLPAGTLLARPGAPVFVLLRGLLAGAFFGAEVLVPLLAAARPGGGPALSGLLLAAGSLGWAAGSWIQGRRADPRRLIVGGCLLITGGTPLMLTGAVPVVAGGWFLAGIGMGLAFATVNRLALEAAEPAEQGRTSSALHVSDTVASILTTGVGATVVTATGRFGAALAMTAGFAAVAAVIALLRTHPREPGMVAADSA